ncbi:MAG: hypothetical protein P3W94_003555 [Paracoccus sp. (in: a-proteobacteria)]|nr:hypothetical protein [Paracoccus sp. (in: a-proteobacteria)]
MTEITASERRLRAALDRIDRILDAGVAPHVPSHESDAPHLARIGALEHALAEARAGQDAAEGHAARLSAANEDLAAANRLLIEADETGGIGMDEAIQALEAEITALREARAAEMAQMEAIMLEVEHMLGSATPTATEGKSVHEAHAVNNDAGSVDAVGNEGDDDGRG